MLKFLEQKVKYLVLVVQLQLLHSLLLKIKCLIYKFSQKTDYDTKISEIEKKLTDHNRDKYITTPEFNNLAAGIFTEDQDKQISNKNRFLIIDS